MNITTDISKFGHRELEILRDTLNAWLDKGLPLSFNENGVHPMFNMDSGYVFLTNEDHEVCMLDEGCLEVYHHCPECGTEGFHYDLRKYGNQCCNEYLDDILNT